jgi:2-oxoglutarate dehydrogenase E2 component (dihydrolipoamide succinyltransferase)
VSNIVVPQLGESIVEARVARWLKKQGDRVEAGEPVVELETEKVDLEVRAEQAGVLSRIDRKEGEDVKIGDVLAVIEDTGAATSAPPPAEESPTEPPASPEPVVDDPPAPDRKTAVPPAPEAVEPRPPVDVSEVPPAAPPPSKAAKAAKTAQAVPPTPPPAASQGRLEERIRMSKRRQTIARRLLEAQRTAAMLTTFNEIDMTSVMDLRARAKEQFKERHGVSLGIVSFFVKASIAALRAFPTLNAEVQDDEIVLKHYYDIGVAVGSEGGLVVPVLRDADRMGFGEIESGIRSFSSRATDGTLTLEDLRGGTFTITNGGVFGSLLSTPILNLPQVGILGLHKIQDRAVALNGVVVIRPMIFVALTYDHRLIDGREAVQFLVTIKEYVEDPTRLMLA